VNGKTPTPYTVAFEVETDAATPLILVELELIPLSFVLIFDSKLINFAPTSIVPTFSCVPAVIEVSADTVNSAERVPVLKLAVVIEVHVIEPFFKFSRSGPCSVILSQTKSRTVISVWFDNVFYFKSNADVNSVCVTSPIAEIV
jgi:hypothetical protein